MRFSRAALVLLPALALAGCGSGAPIPSADQARTIACRGYVLDVGDADVAKGRDMLASVPYNDPTDDPVIAAVRAAANAAGRSPGLSDADFALFRGVVAKIDALRASVVTDDNGDATTGSKAVIAFQAATDAVHKRCY